MILKLHCKNNIDWYYEVKRRVTNHKLKLTFSEFEQCYDESDLKILENFDFKEWRDNPEKIQELNFLTFLDEDLKEMSFIADCDIYLLNNLGETIDIINRA